MDRGDKKSFIKYNYELFAHHIYELNKGLRHLVLHTAPVDTMGYMVKKLEKNSISFFVQKVSNDKCNLFFGEKECIDIIKKFNWIIDFDKKKTIQDSSLFIFHHIHDQTKHLGNCR